MKRHRRYTETLNDWNISAEYWDQYVKKFNVYLTIALKLYNFAEIETNMAVLDVGSGTGYPLSRLILDKIGCNGELYLNDISHQMLLYAKKNNFIEENVHIVCSSASDLNKILPNKKFDRIVSNLSFYHVDNYDKFLYSVYNLLKDEGTFTFTLHNGWFHFNSDFVPENWIDPFHEQIKVISKNKKINIRPSNIIKFSEYEIIDMFERCGFKKAKKTLIFQVERTMDDRYLWLKVPGISFQIFGHKIPINVRNEIIDTAYKIIHNKKTLNTTIICYCFKKNN